ncbi:MAG TPA: FAD-dependent monooxygenase [Holophagaceae bacterium]|nr:FAD-dependent monooxygenase [Holophagaceae bacterium]HJW34719.1 FAD-dependent monooxygenase [Holophagaceae bacterium]
MADLDVAVLGGGPAGLALAGAVARRGWSVAVFEREPRTPFKAGETLGPALRPILEQLGAWEAFTALPTVPFRSLRSAWGGPELQSRDAVLHPLGEGWYVDRVAFEGMLDGVARAQGARVHRGGGPTRVARTPRGFRLEGAGAGVHARLIVDASGRGAPATAGLGAERRWISVDRQVGLLVDLPSKGQDLGTELLLEAEAQGWWYSVPQPTGRLRCVWLTDADLLPPGGKQALQESFQQALARAPHTSQLLAGQTIPTPRVIRADSGFLLPPRGRDWWALGDAALGGDPLGGNGLERGLSGVLESLPDLLATLEGASASAPEEPWARLTAYLGTRGRYYAMESRWPEFRYWARRRAAAPDTVPFWLAPDETLTFAGGPRGSLDRAEAWIPRTFLMDWLRSISEPEPAHQLVARLKRWAPLGDGHLLSGLQVLVEDGALRTCGNLQR